MLLLSLFVGAAVSYCGFAAGCYVADKPVPHPMHVLYGIVDVASSYRRARMLAQTQAPETLAQATGAREDATVGTSEAPPTLPMEMLWEVSRRLEPSQVRTFQKLCRATRTMVGPQTPAELFVRGLVRLRPVKALVKVVHDKGVMVLDMDTEMSEDDREGFAEALKREIEDCEDCRHVDPDPLESFFYIWFEQGSPKMLEARRRCRGLQKLPWWPNVAAAVGGSVRFAETSGEGVSERRFDRIFTLKG